MEEIVLIEDLLTNAWDSFVIIGALFLLIIVWMMLSRGSSDDK